MIFNRKWSLMLYSKPGCHLCEGLQEKLEQIPTPEWILEVCDITTRDDWFQAYQYEIPVLYLCGMQTEKSQTSDESVNDSGVTYQRLPRISPRATVDQIAQMLQKYTLNHSK